MGEGINEKMAQADIIDAKPGALGAAVGALGFAAQSDLSQTVDQERAESALAAANLAVSHMPPSAHKDALLQRLGALSNASSTAHILMVAQSVSAEAAPTTSDTNKTAVEHALLASELEVQWMHNRFELNTAKGRYAFAHALVGPNQPKEVVEAVAYDIEHDPEMRASAKSWNDASPEERKVMKGNRAANAKSVTELAQELSQDESLSAEQRKYFKELADGNDPAHVKGHRKTLEALQKYEQDHNFAELKNVTDGIETKWKSREHQTERRLKANGDHHAHEHAQAAASAEMDLDALVSQPQTAVRQMARSQTGTKAEKAAAISNWSSMTKGADADRTEAIVQQYNATHKGEKIDQDALHKNAAAYVSSHKALGEHAKIVSPKEMIGTAMEAGAQAMLSGNTKAAYDNARKVYDIMAAAGSGYTKDQADVALAILNRGAKNADDAYHNRMGGVMGRDELVAVMSNPTMRKELIRLTLKDIEESTPGNLKWGADLQARTYAATVLSADAVTGKTTNKVIDAAKDMMADRDDFGHNLKRSLNTMNADQNLKKLYDTDHDGKVELWEIRAIMEKNGVTHAPTNIAGYTAVAQGPGHAPSIAKPAAARTH